VAGNDVHSAVPGASNWALLALLVALNTLNFIDRTLPQAFIVDITTELQLSYTQFTLLNGPLFALIYAGMGLVTGALADRVSRTRVIAIGAAFWSLMTAATGAARGIFQFAAMRALVAVGEASLSPSALSMLAQAFPPARHGLATSLYYLGISLGAGCAYAIAGSLGAVVGWRMCFFILGGIGLAMALLCLFFRDPRGAQDPGETRGRGGVAATVAAAIGTLLRMSPLTCVWLAAVLIAFSQGASILDQAWLVHERGFQTAEAQSLVGLVFTLGSLTGALFGGAVADWFAARWAGGRLYCAIWFIVVLTPAGFAFRFVDPNTPAFIALLFAGSAAFTLFYGPLLSSIQALAPERLRATLVAATLLGMALLGTACGNVFAGFLADRIADAGWSMPLRAACLVTQAAALLALPFLLIAARLYKRALPS
jgi:MFS family permease